MRAAWLLAGLLTACASSSPVASDETARADAGELAAAERCTGGARWPRGTAFGFESASPPGARACVPHCGPNETSRRGDGSLTTEALPFGACDAATPCTMRAEWAGTCPASSAGGTGPIDTYVCRCERGSWQCSVDASQQSLRAWECADAPDASR